MLRKSSLCAKFRQSRLEKLDERCLLAVDVFLDFSGFSDRLDEMMDSRSKPRFTAAEVGSIQSSVTQKLDDLYADFDLSFQSASSTGSDATIRFGQIGDSVGLALDYPDFRNQNSNGVADVYTANTAFATVISGFDSARVDVMSQALAWVGAHELGHTFGLNHFDSYGTPAADAAVGATDTVTTVSGLQNQYILATFPTGLQDDFDLILDIDSFSPFSKAKLEFAEGLTPNPASSTMEIASQTQSRLNAQALSLTELPISRLQAANVIGELSQGDGSDWFSFQAKEGELVSVNVLNNMLNTTSNTNPFDSFVRIRSGTDQVLAFNDDTYESSTEIGDQGGDRQFDNIDSLIMNYQIPADGTYYIEVDSANNATGDYNLFMTVANAFHNHDFAADTNRSGFASPIDALLIINAIAANGNSSFVPTPDNTPANRELDVTNDGFVSPLDALRVINAIASQQNGGEGEFSTPSTILSETSYEWLENRSVSGAEYFEFTAANSGRLTVEALFQDAQGDIDVKVYAGVDASQIGESSSWFNDFERVDVDVNTGDYIIVEVLGTNSDVDVRINNMVQFLGSSVNILGTPNNDEVLVDATNSGQFSLQVNGTDYSYAATASNIDFSGGTGTDIFRGYTSSGYDKVYLYPDRYNVDGPNYNIDGTSVETKYVYSNGGNDRAYLYDSASNDQFVGRTSYATLSGPGHYSYVSNFYRVYSFATLGGYDYAYLYDSSGNDTYRSFSSYSTLYGANFYNYASGFERVYAFASSGNDVGYIYDGSGNDLYYAAGTYGYLSGSGQFRYQSRFDTITLNGYYGGTNTLDQNAIDYILNRNGSWLLI